mmetsp:Transcript_913/g.927  ORF Transcript_913/g.927 Transcript_913/m.927 type:complete len:95 (-) Transcript_913:118-402(-)
MTERIYSRKMVVKIDNGLYEIVRLPYLRMSEGQYLKQITIIYMVIFFSYSFLETISWIYLSKEANKIPKSSLPVLFSHGASAVIQPFIIYYLPA